MLPFRVKIVFMGLVVGIVDLDIWIHTQVFNDKKYLENLQLQNKCFEF